ncbi:MAG TPA: heme exporter protein CcmB, partial [Acidimicrobiia bacterium]|nr:heme exporter protein CcmB [Acidimicrobiia bacterium]
VDLPLISRIGPAAYWSTSLLFGMQIAWRNTVADSGPNRDLITLLGVSPESRFWGRTIASAVLLVAFMLLLGVAAVLLFSPQIPMTPWLLLIILLFATGLAMVATLAADITSGLSGRAPLASVLVVPLALPLLVGAAQAVESLRRGGGILPWLLMLAATEIVLAVAGTLAAKPLEDAAR